MNKIEKFYRDKEIIDNSERWTYPINININEDKEIIELGFYSPFGVALKKNEKIDILRLIETDLINHDGLKDIFNKLDKRLKDNLEELKKEIKKDFDSGEVKHEDRN